MEVSTLLLLFIAVIYGSPRIEPLVETNRGLIRGLLSDNGEYSMFLGIPYALVNESNPFGLSMPHPGFNYTYNAFDDSIVCPQIRGTVASGTIQCLHLNIHVPNTATSQNRLPVMVWIHGGAFMRGNGNRASHSPEFLVRHDVIFIAINYRLSAYGFLCLDTPEVPGNQGLKDQLLALKWINENIESFGGDIDKIIIFGESAGSMSVDFHLLFDQEKLFDKVIMQSGPAISPWTIMEANRDIPILIAERLGFVTDKFEDALLFLSNQDPHLVVAASADISSTRSALGTICIEKDFEGFEKLVFDYPINIKSNKIHNISILYGFNSNEMAFQYANAPREFFESYSFREQLDEGFQSEDDDLLDIVRHFYTADEILGENVKNEITDFASDFYFTYPTVRSVKKYVSDGERTVYFYVFSYDGGRNFAKIYSSLNNVTGASHADELGYLFDSDVLAGQGTAADQVMIDRMTTMWTNFAKYGDPTPETSELLPVRWSPVTETSLNYLSIDAELSLQRRPLHSRIAFWDLFYKANENLERGYVEN